MSKLDIRFNAGMVKSWIGKKFEQYKCDAFDFTNSVTQIVGLYIDGRTYALTNIQEPVDYYGSKEDIAIFRIAEAGNNNIKSAFCNIKQIVTPVNGAIEKVKLVNEEQKVKRSEGAEYTVWITRGIIFYVDGREISFEKDNVPFSEEIVIRRGYNLINDFSDEKEFLQDWDEGIVPECHREVIDFSN